MIIRDNSNVDAFLRRLERLHNTKILVGILGEEDSEILLRANANEFGTSIIPERPFIRGAFDKYGKDIGRFSEQLIAKYIDGEMDFEVMTGTIGEYAVSKIRRYMVDLKTPPNAPSTIKQKKSSNPLIDTGQLLSSISYKVVG